MARARQRNEAGSAQIGVLVPADAKHALDNLAGQEGVSLSHYCARILLAALEEVAA